MILDSILISHNDLGDKITTKHLSKEIMITFAISSAAPQHSSASSEARGLGHFPAGVLTTGGPQRCGFTLCGWSMCDAGIRESSLTSQRILVLCTGEAVVVRRAGAAAQKTFG